MLTIYHIRETRPESESMDRWDQRFARWLYLCDTNFVINTRFNHCYCVLS